MLIGNSQGGEEWAREWETESKSKDEMNKERTSMREICRLRVEEQPRVGGGAAGRERGGRQGEEGNTES